MVTGGFTVTVNGWTWVLAPLKSVTLTPNGYCVAEETTGAAPDNTGPLSVSQPGTLLPFQVSGSVPPVAASVCKYCRPEVVAGSEVAVTAGTGLTGSVNDAVPCAPRKSVAVIANW